MAESETVAGDLAEISDGGCVRRTINGREVAIFRRGDNVYAIDATCPHRGGPLDECDGGSNTVITCPWHGWEFDITTGVSPSHPGRVRSYPARVENGRIILGPPNI